MENPEFPQFLSARLRELETQLRVLQTAIAAFKVIQPESAPTLDAIVTEAWRSPAILESIRQNDNLPQERPERLSRGLDALGTLEWLIEVKTTDSVN